MNENQRLISDYYKIVSDIGFIYLENKKLKETYDELMSKWLQRQKTNYEKEKRQRKTEMEKTKADKSENIKTQSQTQENKNSKESNPNTFKSAKPLPNIKKQTKPKKNIKHDEIIPYDSNQAQNNNKKSNPQSSSGSRIHEDYDGFEFISPKKNYKRQPNNVDPDKDYFNPMDSVKRNVLFRRKASKKLKKILKKIYKKLLIKLHPDRSKLEDAEIVCRKLVESFKENDYVYMFYMVKISCLQIYLNYIEIEILIKFLIEELKRIQIKNKLLKKSIADLK